MGARLSWAGSVYLLGSQSEARGESREFLSSRGRRSTTGMRDGDQTENKALQRGLFPHFYQSSEGKFCMHIGSGHKYYKIG